MRRVVAGRGSIVRRTGLQRGHVILIAWLAILSLPQWLVVFSSSPITYTNDPLPVLSSPVEAGSYARLVIGQCNNTKSPISYPITRQLQREDDGLIFLLNAASLTADPGCTVAESRVQYIPDDIPPGRYRLYGVATIPGQFRAYILPWHTDYFEIVNNEQ